MTRNPRYSPEGELRETPFYTEPDIVKFVSELEKLAVNAKKDDQVFKQLESLTDNIQEVLRKITLEKAQESGDILLLEFQKILENKTKFSTLGYIFKGDSEMFKIYPDRDLSSKFPIKSIHTSFSTRDALMSEYERLIASKSGKGMTIHEVLTESANEIMAAIIEYDRLNPGSFSRIIGTKNTDESVAENIRLALQ